MDQTRIFPGGHVIVKHTDPNPTPCLVSMNSSLYTFATYVWDNRFRLILPFRPWLDGARLMLLLVMHIGIATAFVLWDNKFTCPTKTVDEEGVCRLLNMYILIANWIIPATRPSPSSCRVFRGVSFFARMIVVVAYAVGLSMMLYRRKSKAVMPDLESSKSHQHESHNSILPMMVPEDSRHTSVISQQRRGSAWRDTASLSPDQSIAEGKRGSSSSRSRLSKPLPGWMYY
ncbi:hypothetical protein EV360DRAFT_83036 [Lentinula raphanica]|nr:hypothetical protein EV360DRAFT_83036 [Lentinula raphanica]